MTGTDYSQIYTRTTLDRLFPPERTDQFFEALFGDASEGAYDIRLVFREVTPPDRLLFDLQLIQRPGRCLACNLTYGLPEVFSRHPLLNIKGLAQELVKLFSPGASCREWRLGATQSRSKQLHVIPLAITIGEAS